MVYLDIDVTNKSNFKEKMLVDIKIDKTEITKRGYIKKIISNSSQGSKAIKVELIGGEKGRVVGVPSKIELEKENFKFYNLFFNECQIYTVNCNNSFFIFNRNNKNYLYLFSNKELADKIVKGNGMDSKKYNIRPIKKGKCIIKLLKEYNIDFFIIDAEKQLDRNKFEELENKFRNC